MAQKRSIENLQIALSMELTAMHQYQLNAGVLDDWGMSLLASKMREEMQEELRHSEEYMSRIMFLKGEPELVMEKTPVRAASLKEMFESDLADEKEAISFYTKASAQASEDGDIGSRTIFERIALDEEELYSDNYFFRSARVWQRSNQRQLEFPVVVVSVRIATPCFHGGCDGHGWTRYESCGDCWRATLASLWLQGRLAWMRRRLVSIAMEKVCRPRADRHGIGEPGRTRLPTSGRKSKPAWKPSRGYGRSRCSPGCRSAIPVSFPTRSGAPSSGAYATGGGIEFEFAVRKIRVLVSRR